jgi:hypothetical protein
MKVKTQWPSANNLGDEIKRKSKSEANFIRKRKLNYPSKAKN